MDLFIFFDPENNFSKVSSYKFNLKLELKGIYVTDAA